MVPEMQLKELSIKETLNNTKRNAKRARIMKRL